MNKPIKFIESNFFSIVLNNIGTNKGSYWNNITPKLRNSCR